MRRDCFTTCTARDGRTSTPIRTWSPVSVIRGSWSRNAARTGRGTSGAWPGCLPSRWPCLPARATTSRSGTAPSGRRPRTGCCPTPSGRGWRPGSWPVPGSRPRGTSSEFGGSRSGTPRITSTLWRRSPAKMASGRRPGTTSTGSGTPAVKRSGGSDCGPPLRRIAPRPGRPRAPRRNRRPAADGPNRPASSCAGRCPPPLAGQARSGSSSPAWAKPGFWSACGTARSAPARSRGMRWACRTTPARTAG